MHFSLCLVPYLLLLLPLTLQKMRPFGLLRGQDLLVFADKYLWTRFTQCNETAPCSIIAGWFSYTPCAKFVSRFY
jgi:hypothetical protein